MVLAAGAIGAVVGTYLPGVARRVPAGRPVFVRSRMERPLVVAVGAAITAAVYAALAARLGASADLPAFVYLGSVGVALAAIDMRHRRLPNALTLPSYLVGAVLLGIAAGVRTDGASYLRAVAGMAIAFAVYEIMHLIYPAGMGYGDVKLAGLLGLHLAWLGWDVLITGILLGFLAGGVAGAGLVLTGRAGRKSSIPYGPFMLVGAFIAILFGSDIVDWYLGRG